MIAELARADVESFRCALAREAGLRFDDDKLPLLGEVLASRVRTTSSESAAAYVASLRPSGELAEVARTLSVTETYFLRNREQYDAFEAIMRAREVAGLRHLRILSAGCSSGEEAYSLAIAVLATLAEPRAWTLSVVGVDLNPDVLAKARAATYGAWSLRETPDAIRDAYFVSDGSRHRVIDRVRDLVRFEPQNLAQPTAGFWRPEAWDVVFCRNVLMYFTPDAARSVVAGIARSLSPGGYLFLGHAENMRGLSHAFHLRNSHGTFYYQRDDAIVVPPPAEVRVELPASDGAWFQLIDRASERIAALSRGAIESSTTAPLRDLRPAIEAFEAERFHDALRHLDELDAEPSLLRAMILVGTGDLDEAERFAEALLRADGLDAGAHYLAALCREHAGDRPAAVEHAQAAAYLDATFAMPHLLLGRIARRSGDLETACRELAVAAGLLPREDGQRIQLFGGGFNRDALVHLCRAQLRACGGET